MSPLPIQLPLSLRSRYVHRPLELYDGLTVLRECFKTLPSIPFGFYHGIGEALNLSPVMFEIGAPLGAGFWGAYAYATITDVFDRANKMPQTASMPQKLSEAVLDSQTDPDARAVMKKRLFLAEPDLETRARVAGRILTKVGGSYALGYAAGRAVGYFAQHR